MDSSNNAPCEAPAPLHLTSGNRVPEGFIVVFEDSVEDVNARTTALEKKYGFKALFRYTSALKGFAAKLPPAAVAGLRCEAGVKYLEEDASLQVGGSPG